jgi:hypothetical protein
MFFSSYSFKDPTGLPNLLKPFGRVTHLELEMWSVLFICELQPNSTYVVLICSQGALTWRRWFEQKEQIEAPSLPPPIRPLISYTSSFHTIINYNHLLFYFIHLK